MSAFGLTGVSQERLAWRGRVGGVPSTSGRAAVRHPPASTRRGHVAQRTRTASRGVRADGASRPTRTRPRSKFNTDDSRLFNAFESNVNAFLRLVRDTTGTSQSPSFVRGLIEQTLSDTFKRPVSVAKLRLYPDGVVLEGLAIGQNLTVDKLLVRAKLQPLLDVMGEWRTATEGTTAPEIFIDSVRSRGIRCQDAAFDGLRDAFDLYVHAPGAIVIQSLKLYDLSFDIAPHTRFEGRVSAPNRRRLRLAALALGTEDDPVDSRLPVCSLAGCISKLAEPGELAIEAGVDRRRAEARAMERSIDEGSYGGSELESTRVDYYPGTKIVKTDLNRLDASRKPPPKPKPENRDPFASLRSFVPPALMDQVDTNLRTYAPEVIATLNASQAVLESIGPAVLVDVAALGAKGADLARAADLAGITRIGSTGEVVLDVSVVSALVAAGLTDRRWVADGGKLMVKLVESGVGAVLLEKAELLRVLAERRLITRLLDLELMDALLDRPEMTKEMFRSGVVKGALTNGVLEALLAAGKEDVVCGLLRSGMLEILMDTGLLPRMMTYERDPTERIVPPTGSIDLSMDEAQW